jgi:sugar/nucleoside kinase (ribokinase family)
MADVGCAGILVADTFCGPMNELPREGQLLAVGDMPSRAGGCAANVAIDLAKQGVSVDVAGCVGSDASAGVIVSELAEHGVGCNRLVRVPDYPTSKTVILLVEKQDRRYIHTFGANAAFTVGHISREWVAGLKVFYLGGLFLMPAFRTGEFLDLLRFCRAKGVATVVDVVIPKHVDGKKEMEALLPFIDYFLPNNDEARALTGCADPLDQLAALRAAGAGAVIVTCGKDGLVASRKEERWSAGAFREKVVDPSGSGDAFGSGIVTGILRGWDFPRMLAYASALGASAVRAVGTTPGVFTAAEAEAYVAANRLEMHRVK